jgi:hypothetical protein
VHPIEQVRFLAGSSGTSIVKKRPGMALQNLHPRFKSGRRLQSFQWVTGITLDPVEDPM